MARGFESKDVEYQQAERERAQARRPAKSDEQRSADSRRTAIALSLTRMRADLTKATAFAHRTMIERAIATLEAELASLS
jgi:glutathionyl-hydroquinone reductase